MVDMNKQKTHGEIIKELDKEEYSQEVKMVHDNLLFEQEIMEKPLPPGTGSVDVFGFETWDINMILKGNYWGRSIYTTDKICKLFLKWNLERQKKYLRKKNMMDFDWTFILVLMIIGVVALIAIIFLLPQFGGMT